MRKHSWLSLLLALVLALTCMSVLAEDTINVDDLSETVIATINGEPITYSEMLVMYQTYASQYSASGMDINDETTQQSLMNMAFNAAIQEKLIKQQATAEGLDAFTDEEEASFTEQAQTYYDQMKQMLTLYNTDSSLSDEEKAAQAEEQMNTYGYSVEQLAKNNRDSEIFNRVYEFVNKDVDIPDSAVQSAYDDALKDAQDRYSEDPSQYLTDSSKGSTIYCVPEGYRTVKHILVKYDKAKDLKAAQAKLLELTEADDEYAETKASIEEMTAEIQPKLDEIQARIDNGEDFQALIEEYGEDPGMKSGDSAETGYLLCDGTTIYVSEFTAGGMALEKVGDVSEPILTDYGYHFIRYDSDVEPSVVPFDDVKDALKEDLLNEAKQSNFTTKLTEWYSSANIEYNNPS